MNADGACTVNMDAPQAKRPADELPACAPPAKARPDAPAAKAQPAKSPWALADAQPTKKRPTTTRAEDIADLLRKVENLASGGSIAEDVVALAERQCRDLVHYITQPTAWTASSTKYSDRSTPWRIRELSVGADIKDRVMRRLCTALKNVNRTDATLASVRIDVDVLVAALQKDMNAPGSRRSKSFVFEVVAAHREDASVSAKIEGALAPVYFRMVESLQASGFEVEGSGVNGRITVGLP